MYVDAVCMYDYAQFVCQSQLFKECKHMVCTGWQEADCLHIAVTVVHSSSHVINTESKGDR